MGIPLSHPRQDALAEYRRSEYIHCGSSACDTGCKGPGQRNDEPKVLFFAFLRVNSGVMEFLETCLCRVLSGWCCSTG